MEKTHRWRALQVADLSGANLMSKADLSGANLSGANLSGAYLSGANLRWANLSKANLSRADLSEANLRAAVLPKADLSGADLSEADLFSVFLDGANFERATVGYTIFASVNLSSCSGLDSVKHVGPSTLGVDSIIRSKGRIPEIFLRGVGLPDGWITYIPSLVGDDIQFFSCFISYSSLDKPFAVQLHDALQSKGYDAGEMKSNCFPVMTYQESYSKAFTRETNSCSVRQKTRSPVGG